MLVIVVALDLLEIKIKLVKVNLNQKFVEFKKVLTSEFWIFFADVNECLNPTICKNGSTCINLIGSYECDCGIGYEYVNETCQS